MGVASVGARSGHGRALSDNGAMPVDPLHPDALMPDPDRARAEVIAAEEELRLAMLQADAEVLDRRIAPALRFTNHLGQVFGKSEDLAAHRGGDLRLAALAPSEQQVVVHGATAIVSVRMQVVGVHAGRPFAGDYRYTRCWVLQADGVWRVLAGHVSELPPPAR